MNHPFFSSNFLWFVCCLFIWMPVLLLQGLTGCVQCHWQTCIDRLTMLLCLGLLRRKCAQCRTPFYPCNNVSTVRMPRRFSFSDCIFGNCLLQNGMLYSLTHVTDQIENTNPAAIYCNLWIEHRHVANRHNDIFAHLSSADFQLQIFIALQIRSAWPSSSF